MNQDEMNKVYKKMDELCNKKKKENKKDAETYKRCFDMILEQNGYDEKAENYFFDGYSYLNAEPLFSFIMGSKDRLSRYRKITLSKRFQRTDNSSDQQKKLRFELALLALALKDAPQEKEIAI